MFNVFVYGQLGRYPMYKNNITFVFQMFYDIETYFGNAPSRQWTQPGEICIDDSSVKNNFFQIMACYMGGCFRYYNLTCIIFDWAQIHFVMMLL